MAASVLVTVPLVILVLIFQRRIVSGLTAGALKG
jgi:trehalose/maltose transport system permease protein